MTRQTRYPIRWIPLETYQGMNNLKNLKLVPKIGSNKKSINIMDLDDLLHESCSPSREEFIS